MKIIGIVGSRRRNKSEDYKKVLEKFEEIYEVGDKIVSGGCPKGGDRFAEIIAKELDIPIIIHYPNWSRQGRAAGFIRNVLIVRDCDILIACVLEDRKGGTEDTIKKAERLGKEVYLV